MKTPRVALLLGILFCFLTLPAFAQDAMRLISEADAAFTAADYRVAIEKYSAALPLMPDHASELREVLAECYLLRGNASFDKGDLKATIADYTKGLEYGPAWPAFFFNRGLCKYSLNDYDGALPDFGEALRLNAADHPEAYEYRGRSFYAKREYEKAIAEFSAGIEREPGKYSLWVGRGETRYKLKDYAAGIADLDKAVELNPKSPSAHLVRARIKSARSDTEGAIADYSVAIANKPDYADALRERAKLLHDKKDYEGEASDYIALFAARPDEKSKLLANAFSASSNAGDARVAKGGDHGGAIEDYVALLTALPFEATRLNPLLSAQYEERGSDSSATADYTGAAADYAKAAALREGGMSALHLVAMRGDAKLLSAMLKAGAPPNAKDADGTTALMHAVNVGSLDAVKALVSGKASPKEDGIIWVDRKNKQFYGSVLCAAAVPTRHPSNSCATSSKT